MPFACRLGSAVRALLVLFFLPIPLAAAQSREEKKPDAGKGKAPAVYHCVGFDEPQNKGPIQVGKGRVLPLRVKLADDGGGFGDDSTVKAHPMVRVAFQPESGAEVDKTDEIDLRDYGVGRSFVFDKEAHWKFDLGTLKFKQDGTFKVTVLSGDEAEYKVDPTCELVFHLHGGH
jgi:hypothetical protein